jgi:hypothetical protein
MAGRDAVPNLQTEIIDLGGGAIRTAGVALESLERGTILDVKTWNTRYRVVVLDGEGRAVISGGRRFQEPTEVRIEGSTAGGRDLKIGWIGIGLRLELSLLSLGPHTVTTSPIQSVEAVEPVAA